MAHDRCATVQGPFARSSTGGVETADSVEALEAPASVRICSGRLVRARGYHGAQRREAMDLHPGTLWLRAASCSILPRSRRSCCTTMATIGTGEEGDHIAFTETITDAHRACDAAHHMCRRRRRIRTADASLTCRASLIERFVATGLTR